MTAREWRFGEKRVTQLCADPAAPVAYVNGSAAVPEELGWTVIFIERIDWNRELTPWPAKAVFRGQPDFGGGADAYLRELMQEIIPVVEEDLRPAARIIAGYSLAGLFAVYAALETKLFRAIASVSGSMWYPGFAEYAAHKHAAPEIAYFSVGEREKLGRSAAFHSIEECTQRVCDCLAARGARTAFELNPGGHFNDTDGRMRRAFDWLNKNLRGEEPE